VNVAGSLIVRARHRSGLSQRALADRSGTSPAAIAFYESGARVPRIDVLLRILRAAGFDLRMRLEPADRYSETLDQVLDEYYSEDDVRASRARRGRDVKERRAALETER